jgi:hypothetical protein
MILFPWTANSSLFSMLAGGHEGGYCGKGHEVLVKTGPIILFLPIQSLISRDEEITCRICCQKWRVFNYSGSALMRALEFDLSRASLTYPINSKNCCSTLAAVAYQLLLEVPWARHMGKGTQVHV